MNVLCEFARWHAKGASRRGPSGRAERSQHLICRPNHLTPFVATYVQSANRRVYKRGYKMFVCRYDWLLPIARGGEPVNLNWENETSKSSCFSCQNTWFRCNILNSRTDRLFHMTPLTIHLALPNTEHTCIPAPPSMDSQPKARALIIQAVPSIVHVWRCWKNAI